jgi:hypothetical protein
MSSSSALDGGDEVDALANAFLSFALFEPAIGFGDLRDGASDMIGPLSNLIRETVIKHWYDSTTLDGSDQK